MKIGFFMILDFQLSSSNKISLKICNDMISLVHRTLRAKYFFNEGLILSSLVEYCHKCRKTYFMEL